MYAFKFVSVSAIFLLALVQGAVSQGVPSGGSCVTIAGFVCIGHKRISMLLTTRYSIFCRKLVPKDWNAASWAPTMEFARKHADKRCGLYC
ncbi:hypothetical protein FB451DRAFT_1564909 [Mycena latifolia]|nr:hypothetical protein FB451DRAFT_1564909 [Mycena latifolia]